MRHNAGPPTVQLLIFRVVHRHLKYERFDQGVTIGRDPRPDPFRFPIKKRVPESDEPRFAVFPNKSTFCGVESTTMEEAVLWKILDLSFFSPFR
ncbi:hypothetical protein BHE74_00035236 [Ensete ventricosum]|nr:hypothetical protein BHE74_00035236 [Ensete ventricosum]